MLPKISLFLLVRRPELAFVPGGSVFHVPPRQFLGRRYGGMARLPWIDVDELVAVGAFPPSMLERHRANETVTDEEGTYVLSATTASAYVFDCLAALGHRAANNEIIGVWNPIYEADFGVADLSGLNVVHIGWDLCTPYGESLLDEAFFNGPEPKPPALTRIELNGRGLFETAADATAALAILRHLGRAVDYEDLLEGPFPLVPTAIYTVGKIRCLDPVCLDPGQPNLRLHSE